MNYNLLRIMYYHNLPPRHFVPPLLPGGGESVLNDILTPHTLPHNLRHAVRLEVLVRFAEVAVAEEAVVGGEGRGMGGGEHQVLAAVYEGAFALGVSSPEDEDEVFFPVGQQADDAVGKGLPAVALVRACLVGAYGEGGVEQQHALPGPAGEVACGGWLGAYVVFNFLEDVDERRGEGNAIVYREA